MVIRACLVALDWNYGVNRKHKKGENGELLYREKVDIKLYFELRKNSVILHSLDNNNSRIDDYLFLVS